jgi:hypothetical protein
VGGAGGLGAVEWLCRAGWWVGWAGWLVGWADWAGLAGGWGGLVLGGLGATTLAHQTHTRTHGTAHTRTLAHPHTRTHTPTPHCTAHTRTLAHPLTRTHTHTHCTAHTRTLAHTAVQRIFQRSLAALRFRNSLFEQILICGRLRHAEKRGTQEAGCPRWLGHWRHSGCPGQAATPQASSSKS